MKKYIFYFISLIFIISTYSFGTIQKKDLIILMDIEYKGNIYLYDKPDGRVIKKMKHDMDQEDLIVFFLTGKNDSMFHVKAYYSIKGFIAEGWIKKSKRLKIFDRASYSEDYPRPLTLYSKPSINSRIIVKATDYDTSPSGHTVIDLRCNARMLILLAVNTKICNFCHFLTKSHERNNGETGKSIKFAATIKTNSYSSKLPKYNF